MPYTILGEGNLISKIRCLSLNRELDFNKTKQFIFERATN